MKGTIHINEETGTVSIQLENGHYATDFYPAGAKLWLETEIQVLQREKAINDIIDILGVE
jgi:hypothetical protein